MMMMMMMVGDDDDDNDDDGDDDQTRIFCATFGLNLLWSNSTSFGIGDDLQFVCWSNCAFLV